MEQLIKIVNSPFTSNLEVFENIIIKLYVPYSSKDVTIQISPYIQDHLEKQDNPNVQVRQVFVTSSTKDTQTLTFDFRDNNVHKLIVGNNTFEMKLMNIGKENIQGQDFPFFEFHVVKL